MKVDFDVLGLAELEKKLQEIGVAASAKTLRKAGREAMAGVQFAIAMGAGFDPESKNGHMRDDIKMSTKIGDSKNGARSNAVAVRVGPSKKHAQKAIAQEFGTETQTADPFMRPSLFENKERVANTFKTSLAQAIDKAARKQARAGR